MASELHRQWGATIRSIRSARGISMAEMAEELGVSGATVSRWETGLQCPRDEMKVEIASVLNTDVRVLFPLVRMTPA